MKEWKYYNHAVIPAIAPHLVPDLTVVKNKSVFKRAVCGGGGQLLLHSGLLTGIVRIKLIGGM